MTKFILDQDVPLALKKKQARANKLEQSSKEYFQFWKDKLEKLNEDANAYRLLYNNIIKTKIPAAFKSLEKAKERFDKRYKEASAINREVYEINLKTHLKLEQAIDLQG